MNLILTLYDEETTVLINWNNVCYAEAREADGEEPHARIHFNVTAVTGVMTIDVQESVDDLASLLEDGGQPVLEIDDDDDEEQS